ncbi:NAD-dependent epimerase/dehydratase family protein [Brachyspira pilosicoli]|uniref:NAD-dependent epimerase/dehydratase family protein n=1 Tax=Brachyspira pilosicoli TaxID=52584 RepID=UPI0012F4C875|nr:NAD-dependent epimerase/dehydratase family protein [Brachyspira pilosicoli]MBW5392073.1 SDR family oxidoreductase [Brachyspira pilosicoli]
MNKIIESDIEYIINNSNINFSIFRNKTVLITGATGMLTSYMVMVLSYLNIMYKYNIYIIAMARDKNKFNNKFKDFLIDRNLVFTEFDIYNFNDSILSSFNINYIIHTASPSRSDQFLLKPLDIIYPNVFITNTLLNYSRNSDIYSFLYFSTSDIYGKVENGYISENIYGSLDNLDARNVYGESKRMGETLCKSYYSQYNIPIKIVRIAHTYAPTMDLINDSRVFAEFVKNIVENKNIVMKSSGKGLRSFCYIVDAVIGYFKVLINGKNGEAYNVANNRETTSIIELAKLLINMYPEKKLSIKIEKQNEIYLENNNMSSLDKLFIDTKKLEELGWNPQFNIQTGFKRVIEYFEIERNKK